LLVVRLRRRRRAGPWASSGVDGRRRASLPPPRTREKHQRETESQSLRTLTAWWLRGLL